MGPISNGGTGLWGTGVIGAQRVWGTEGMGYKGYGPHQQWVTWAMGYMGNGVQGYGQWGPWAICTQNVKKMSSCQKDVKLSKRCQMSKKSKHLDYGGCSQKNYIDIMRFTHIDVNFDIINDGH